ncbi:MAG: Unknown protein [uncultured Sulfurovum sp.]|uniref:Outer membrane protein beta-barrel domain-containing protein n=1 Tax=uncultured Sulfurovum sp. TaxID=269237 RepID=A0A6S6SLM1_9BACT|nr:MAG: Unknown protein [uncultured Sulfurovum sp.]
MINITMIGMSTFLYAGGDILPPIFETEEVSVPIEVYVPPVKIVDPTPPVPAVIPPAVILKDIVPLGFYVGLGLTAASYDPKCGCTQLKSEPDTTTGIIARVGYDFNEYLGIEGRGIRTNWRSDGGKIKHAGVFVKPMYPISKDFNVYGLAGYAKTTTQGSKRQVDAETLAWGVGVEYDLGTDTAKKGKYSRDFDGYGDQEGGWGLFADYERLVQKSASPDLDTISFGVTYDF